jgi:hypothetical protein
MQKLLIILTAALWLSSCNPASKQTQLEKISKTGKDMFDAGYSSDALPYAEKALEFSIREFGEMSQETARVSQDLAFLFYEKRMFGSSRKEYSRLIRILNTIPGADKKDLIAAYTKLASISLAFEDIDGALQLYQLITKLQKKFLGETHEETIDSMFMMVRIQAYLKNYSGLYKDVDRLIRLVEKKEEINTIKIKKFLELKLSFTRDEKNPEKEIATLTKLINVFMHNKAADAIEVAKTLNQRADVHIALGHFQEALKDSTNALEINLKKCDKTDPQLITTYQKLATIHQRLQNIPETETALIEAKKLASQGSLNDDLFEQTIQMLSTHYLMTEDFEKAKSTLIEVLQLHKETLGESHPNLVYDYNILADCYASLRQYIQAQAVLEESLLLVSQSYGETSIHAINQINRMAMLNYKAEQYPQAITKCNKAIELLNAVYPDTHPTYMPLYKSLTLIYKTKKDLNKAALFSVKALKVSEFIHGNQSPDILQELTDLVDIYTLQNNTSEAISFAQRSVKILEIQKDGDRLDLAEKLNVLGTLYETSGNKPKANELFEKSRKIYAEPRK